MPDLAIDRLKRELTDKYVTVTGGRPELARFEGYVGQVKTVNFSGRALVEFTGYHNNPAWFDIDPICLRIVDEPPKPDPLAKKAPPPATKTPAKAAGPSAADILAAVRGGGKAAPKPDASGRTPASAAPVAKKADAASKGDKKVSPSVGQSTADILAAARAKKAAAPAAADEAKVEGKRTSPSVGLSTADVLAAARGGGGKPSATPASSEGKVQGKRTSPAVGLSTADVLAAARGKKPAPTAAAADSSSKDSSSAPKTQSPRPSGMTTEEILAAARGGKKPAHEEAKPSAIDALADGSHQPEPRRHLTAADIRDIGLGKLSIRREPIVVTTPLPKKPHVESPAPHIDALPKKIDESCLTAADILKMGLRK